MKPKRGPVILFGPPVQYQAWIVSDVELIRNWLQDKYGLVGVVYKESSFVSLSNWNGYGYQCVGMA